MNDCVRGLACSLLFTALLPAQPAANAGLPVKRVVLYKNGVGYFELQGRVQGNQDVAIPFTSGQLNDVLKSLTVLDLGGGRITGVGYGSSAPLDRQLGDLRLPLAERGNLNDFLGALRGARVEIRSSGATVAGRVLGVERKTRSLNGIWNDIDIASVLTESGEVRTAELTPGFSLKLLDAGLNTRVDRYLDIVSANREADVRRMTVSTEGTGARDLFVSYVSEVPVWKSTYRIVLGGKEPLLQGWAIVDNTVGQDWESVQLSLVAGAPQSFVQNLSQPYFTRRPSVPLPDSVSMAPQTYQATLLAGSNAQLRGRVSDPSNAAVPGARLALMDTSGSIVAETTADGNGVYEFTSVPPGRLRLTASSAGFQTTVVDGLNASPGMGLSQDLKLQVGSSAQTVTVQASANNVNTSSSSMAATNRNSGSGRNLGSGGALNRAFVPSTAGGVVGGIIGSVPSAAPPPPPPPDVAAQELGDLFEYKLKSPISIRKNQSALVPIAQAPIGAEKISVWNDRAGLPRPVRALWLTNTSGLTLDGGSFSVLEEETFAGEGLLDPIRPGEKRIVSYALDLALNASSKNATEAQRVTRVRASEGVMIHESELRTRKTYTFRNEDSSPRTVLVEHPVIPGFTLRSEPRPVETTADWMRFRVAVPSKQSVQFVVEEARPVETQYRLSDLSLNHLELFIRQKSINKAVEDALRKILDQKHAAGEIESRKEARDEEMKRIFDDQQRLRENMRSLKGSSEEKQLLLRYTGQLNEQETRLEKLQKEIAALATESEAADEKLSKLIRELTVDVKM
jgi:hypothetical protein